MSDNEHTTVRIVATDTPAMRAMSTMRTVVFSLSAMIRQRVWDCYRKSTHNFLKSQVCAHTPD